MRNIASEFTGRFGDLLKSARKSRGRTQLSVATEIHADHSVISRWEKAIEHPKLGQLHFIRRALALTDAEFEPLYFAWKREADSVPVEFMDRGSRPIELIEFTEQSIILARQIRKGGQPRSAMLLCERDTKFTFDRIREQPWSQMHPEMLARVAELLVEQCKASLDYVSRSDVRNGALQEVLVRLRMVERACRTEITRFYADLATEGVTYVGGNVSGAFGQSLQMIGNQDKVPPAWRPEVLRAAAINAGKIENREALERTETLITRLLDASQPSLAGGEDAFLLEGLARGWANLDPERGNETIMRAWAAREASTGFENASQLRYVQLVRSEAEIVSADMDGADVRAMAKKIRTALTISSVNGYDRYVDQLGTLLNKFSA